MRTAVLGLLSVLLVACGAAAPPLRLAQSAGCEACLKSFGCESTERSCTAGCDTRHGENGIERRQCLNSCSVEAQSCRERAPKNCSVACKSPNGAAPSK